MNLKHLALFCASLTLAGMTHAETKPEDIIKARQAAYSFLAWNNGRIKAALEAPTYNKDEVVKAANAIQAIANSGLGALYVKGTDQGVGFHDSKARPEAFDPAFTDKLAEVAGNFNREANALATAAAGGNKDVVKAQFARLGETCKGCHDNFKVKNR